MTDFKGINSINDEAENILKTLHTLKDKSSHETLELLGKFRVLTREKCLSEQVLNDDCLDLLVRLSSEGQVEAQKCLSNLILNYSHLRDRLSISYIDCVRARIIKYTDELKYPEHDSDRLKSDGFSTSNIERSVRESNEEIYYDLRILFLLSALCPASRVKIRDQTFELLVKLANREADRISKENFSIVIESLKNIFNLSMNDTPSNTLAGDVIIKLFGKIHSEEIFLQSSSGSEPSEDRDGTNYKDQLLVNLIHLLTNMPDRVYLRLSLTDSDSIINFLDNLLGDKNRKDYLNTVLPILNTCSNICKYNEEIRQKWFDELIGSSNEFDKRPEQYDTFRGRLVRLMTSLDVRIKDIAAEFMYSLCGSDSEKFITYSGFGNAAAFLAGRGLMGQPSRRTGSTSEDAKYLELREKIDPITGKLDLPKTNSMEGMTEEEKEYHANELANAITRLTNLGVVSPMKIGTDGKIVGIHPVHEKDLDRED